MFDNGKWRPRRDPLRRAAPAGLQVWLEDTASLTARLRRFCANELRVQVLREYWTRPSTDEARLLGLAPGCYARLREVLLMCGDTPWVYARTVIPLATLRGRQRSLLRLGSRPLGSVLFSRRQVRRSPLQIRRLREGDALLTAVRAHAAGGPGLWARRSALHFSGCGLLVTEVFLPQLVARVVEEEA